MYPFITCGNVCQLLVLSGSFLLILPLRRACSAVGICCSLQRHDNRGLTVLIGCSVPLTALIGCSVLLTALISCSVPLTALIGCSVLLPVMIGSSVLLKVLTGCWVLLTDLIGCPVLLAVLTVCLVPKAVLIDYSVPLTVLTGCSAPLTVLIGCSDPVTCKDFTTHQEEYRAEQGSGETVRFWGHLRDNQADKWDYKHHDEAWAYSTHSRGNHGKYWWLWLAAGLHASESLFTGEVTLRCGWCSGP